jgi:hypothetical protein
MNGISYLPGGDGAGGFGAGGGGGARTGTAGAGGNGGGGTIRISYPDNFANAVSTTGSPTLTTTGGLKIYTFTANGSITF